MKLSISNACPKCTAKDTTVSGVAGSGGVNMQVSCNECGHVEVLRQPSPDERRRTILANMGFAP